MAPQATVKKVSESEWFLALQDGSELPILPSDIQKYYVDANACQKAVCGCYKLTPSTVVEYMVVEVDGVSYGHLI